MRFFLVAALLSVSLTALGQGASETQVSQLVKSFEAAEEAYDVQALSRLITERFVEISPSGEIDGHDRFLSFYTPDKKVAWPPHTMREEPIRLFGDTAVDIVTFHYEITRANGATHPMDIRSTFIAQRQGDAWKLIQTQHTGIRSAPTVSK